jgi:hypothetical protein
MMTLEKQVRIPANRHIHMDVDFTLPEAWTPGEVISLLIRPIPQTASTVEEVVVRLSEQGTGETKSEFKHRILAKAKTVDREQAESARLRLLGMFKTDGRDVERFLGWKQSEREIEYAIEQREDKARAAWRKN